MNDLVKLLRDSATHISDMVPGGERCANLRHEAADEIERLKQENDFLKETCVDKAVAWDKCMHEVERCAKLAEDYEEWTYWGQDDNYVAAVAASKEIAAAIRRGRWLTTNEIKEVDKKRNG